MDDVPPLTRIHEPPIKLSKTPDSQTKLELDDILNHHPDYLQEKIKQERAKTQRLEEEIHNLQADRKARRQYGYGVFLLVLLYIGTLGCFLWLVASHNHYQLSDRVLMTLLCSTSVSMIALLMVVVRYLFPTQSLPIRFCQEDE